MYLIPVALFLQKDMHQLKSVYQNQHLLLHMIVVKWQLQLMSEQLLLKLQVYVLQLRMMVNIWEFIMMIHMLLDLLVVQYMTTPLQQTKCHFTDGELDAQNWNQQQER